MLNCPLYDATPDMLLDIPLETLLMYRKKLRAIADALEHTDDNMARFLCALNMASLRVVEEALGLMETALASASPEADAQKNIAETTLQELLNGTSIQLARDAGEQHLTQGTIVPDRPAPVGRAPKK